MNDLKGINDNHGHASGDTMIKAMAAELTNAFPGRNVFFRIGGDEFLCVLFDMESENRNSNKKVKGKILRRDKRPGWREMGKKEFIFQLWLRTSSFQRLLS